MTKHARDGVDSQIEAPNSLPNPKSTFSHAASLLFLPPVPASHRWVSQQLSALWLFYYVRQAYTYHSGWCRSGKDDRHRLVDIPSSCQRDTVLPSFVCCEE